MKSRCFITAMLAGALGLAAAAETFRVEIDYMGADGDGHDHMPDQIVLDAVIQMFACQGHTLIIDLDDEVPHTDLLTGNPGTNMDCRDFWTYTGVSNTYRNYRNTYRDRGAGWHYCLFAHQYRIDSNPGTSDSGGCTTTSSSGRANGGDAFIVTLGAFDGQTGTLYAQAGTLAHEFGHNLGLSHCGSQDCDATTEYVQNMPSVMAYTYQLSGVKTQLLSLGFVPDYAPFKEIDFSHGRMCSLNENSLNETTGTRMMRVDFNCDNDTSDSVVVQDLGFRGGGLGSSAPWCGETDVNRSTLTDYNEWANINDGATLVALAEEGDGEALFRLDERLEKSRTCITKEEWDEFVSYNPDIVLGGGPPLAIEGCIATGRNAYVATSSTFSFGLCGFPFSGVILAQSSSPNNAVYWMTPGTYDQAGTTVLNKPGIWSCNTGTARIE
ncbi:MAG: M43 family zinc metalloprotease [Phycisphaerae bacterium]